MPTYNPIESINFHVQETKSPCCTQGKFMKKFAITETSQIALLIDKVYQIAKNNPSGFTINLNSLQFITSGYVAAYKATQNSFGLSGLQNAINYALSVGSNIVGGWYNSANDMFYFDASKTFDNLKDAADFGLENEQLAIFNLNNSQEIRLS